MSEIDQTDRTLRVLTANLYAERLDLDGFRLLLKDLNPDVAVVQELSFAAADVLAEFLPHGLLIPEDGHDGRGLALKAPADLQLLPMAYRDGLIAILDPPDWPGSVEIVNVHMANPILWPPWASLRLRRQQLDALMAHLAEPAVRLVAGDFNASPAWPVYRRLAAHLDDAAMLLAKQQGSRPARTWGPIPGTPRMLRIDHVFVEKLEPVNLRAVDLPGSDHSGLLVEVRLG
jgi:endonuclease/exonuclease/phosphatase family metal-dependent hydrolase